MKKILYTLLVGSSMLIAENGPLYISNVTFTPNGECEEEEAAANITVTGASGVPTAEGTYTFTLTEPDGTSLKTLTGKTVTFENIALPESDFYFLTITDSTNNLVEYAVAFSASSTESVSFTIDSLPQGTGPGCITMAVTNPGGTPVTFGATDENSTSEQPITVVKNQAPFSQTFSIFANNLLGLNVGISGDCEAAPAVADFTIVIPFPQGQGNALKGYIYNKYCSCTLQPGTVPVIFS